MRTFRIMSLTLVGLAAMVPVLVRGPAAKAEDRADVAQMTEEQIKQKLFGLGFSEVSDLKKITVTKYRWTGKGTQSGKQLTITIDEFGQVSAK